MLKIGLAGKPNAGKSTFFKAATLVDVETANYPFTTIDANQGIAGVRTECPCLELEQRCGNCKNGKRYVPVELIDVAGLVPKAHEGKGLGNEFLDELRRADGIINIVDSSGSTNIEGEPVEKGTHDPTEDLGFIEEELDAWITEIIREDFERLKKKTEVEKGLAEHLTGLGITIEQIKRALRKNDKPIKKWENKQIEKFAAEIRKTKPLLVSANKIDNAPERYIEKLLSRDAIPTSAQAELALRNGAENNILRYDPGDTSFKIKRDITEKQQKSLEKIRNLIEKYGGTGVQKSINTLVFDKLELITAYPVEDASKWTDSKGQILPDAYLLPKGSTPKDLAYKIHTDIGEKYLHAIDAKTNRKIGNKPLQNGDVIKIQTT